MSGPLQEKSVTWTRSGIFRFFNPDFHCGRQAAKFSRTCFSCANLENLCLRREDWDPYFCATGTLVVVIRCHWYKYQVQAGYLGNLPLSELPRVHARICRWCPASPNDLAAFLFEAVDPWDFEDGAIATDVHHGQAFVLDRRGVVYHSHARAKTPEKTQYAHQWRRQGK